VGKVFDGIDDRLRAWMARQPLFFVGSAPLDPDGHVNLSPKGPIESFAVLDDHTVAYLDVVGSGAETVAHLRENGRIVIMFCAFTGPPKIVRLHGRGRVVRPDDPEFDELRPGFDKDRAHGQRSIIVVDLDRVADSCGYSVPRLDFVEDRNILDLRQLKKPSEYYDEYWDGQNAASIDGLPTH
jgi:hypothetical protein